MKSMELSDEAKIDAIMPIAMEHKPDFPYGLRICLTEAELKTLGIDINALKVGETFEFKASARITSISCDESESGTRCRVESQIEEMAVGEDEDEPKAGRRKINYKT